jgi:hypothetical protein
MTSSVTHSAKWEPIVAALPLFGSKEDYQMHQRDGLVVMILVLASVIAIKLAPAVVVALLVTLVRYRRAAR